jgi:hypothetical protein
MSKWVNTELYEKFLDEIEKDQSGDNSGMAMIKWPGLEKGTADKPKIYEGRFLQDPDGIFYKKYYYHMFSQGEGWKFLFCEKTHNFDNFCPWCIATQRLYAGSAADKAQAGNYKRKEKYVANFYVVDDPRDAESEDDRKNAGKVWLYEFPSKLESKIKNELTDKKNGLGLDIFDPSEDGYNFIVKVKSTKPQKDGKVWPDYSDSVFARKASALGAESQIKEIMSQRHSIAEFLASMFVSDDTHIDLLKNEMLWQVVEKDWIKYKGAMAESPKSSETDKHAGGMPAEKSAGPSGEDDDILKELENF